VIELVQILVQVTGLRGGAFDAVAKFNFLGVAGYVIVAAFVVTWAAALVIYKVRRIDERWGAAVDKVA
jgi:high-affinity nickel-transport protein